MVTTLYDAWEHADSMEIPVVRRKLTMNYGGWFPAQRLIILDIDLPQEFEMPILAHECDHAEHNDPPGHHHRFEARANLHSAQRLIDPREFDAQTAMTQDYDRICLELGVTREQFVAYNEYRKRQREEALRFERLGDVVYLDPKMGEGQWAMRIGVANG